MDRQAQLALLTDLLTAHSVSGAEDEIDVVIRPRLAEVADEVWQDPAGNLVGLIHGTAATPGRGLAMTAHKDEIGMIVKRVEADGRLRIRNVGGSYAWKYGEGPVDVLGDNGIVPGILSFGSAHISREAGAAYEIKTSRALTWDLAWIETRQTPEYLAAQGVHPGVRAVIGRDRKKPTVLGDFVSGFALDCKAAVVAMLIAGADLMQRRPMQDIYLLASSEEETTCQGASYAARTLPIETMIAIEVAPVADEYPLVLDARPVLMHYDDWSLYSQNVIRAIAAAAKSISIDVQHVVVSGFGSDASLSHRYGQIARGACIAYATLNTHGYEITHLDALPAIGRVLAQYARQQE